MPIHPNSIRVPTNPVSRTYVPPNGYQYPVQLSDSWQSLAPAGMSAWSLIRYNYPTLPADLQLASKEVNWYLQNYVGCTLLTEDNRNYRFNPPGQIWLPNAPLTQDDIARQIVLSTLRSQAVNRLNFGVGPVWVFPSDYKMVLKAIEAGQIVVKARSGHIAYYHSSSTPALLEISTAMNDPGLIIHECTHAIFDMKKLTSHVSQSEAFGYLSQALYGWIVRGGAPANRYIPSKDPSDPISQEAWQYIFDESTRLAGILVTRFWVSETEATILFNSIANANIYRSQVGNVVTYDGI